MRSKVLLCILGLLLISFSVNAQKRSFGDVVDDTLIASKLRIKFMNDKLVPAKDIKIKVLQGVVTLNGELTTQDEINRAIEISEKQNGVREVKAYLVLKEFGELRSEPDKKGHGFSLFGKRGESKPKQDNKDSLKEKDLGSEVKPVKTAETTQPIQKAAQEQPIKSVSNNEEPRSEDFKEFE